MTVVSPQPPFQVPACGECRAMSLFTNGVLVRMSLVSEDADLAVRTLSTFGTTMLEAVAKPSRPVLIGSL